MGPAVPEHTGFAPMLPESMGLSGGGHPVDHAGVDEAARQRQPGLEGQGRDRLVDAIRHAAQQGPLLECRALFVGHVAPHHPGQIDRGNAGDHAVEVVDEAREQRADVAAHRDAVDGKRGRTGLGARPRHDAPRIPDRLADRVQVVQVIEGERLFAVRSGGARAVDGEDRLDDVQAEVAMVMERPQGEQITRIAHPEAVEVDDPGSRLAMSQHIAVGDLVARGRQPAGRPGQLDRRLVFALEGDVLVTDPSIGVGADLYPGCGGLGVETGRVFEDAGRFEQGIGRLGLPGDPIEGRVVGIQSRRRHEGQDQLVE